VWWGEGGPSLRGLDGEVDVGRLLIGRLCGLLLARVGKCLRCRLEIIGGIGGSQLLVGRRHYDAKCLRT